jgi:cellulose 1,4-beta-cellobiosidase
MTSPVSSVSDLDLGPIAADAVSRGYMTDSWYLIDVEAGFETWVGGQGLTANSFSVLVK